MGSRQTQEIEMADERTFVLISEFRDGVTPALENINKSINALKANLGSFGAKKGGFNDLTKSMGKVIGAHKMLSEEVKTLRSELTKSIPILREYRKEVGKTVGANMMLQGKGKGQRFNKKNNPTLQFLEAATQQTRLLAQASRGVRLGGRVPRGGGGRGGNAYVPRSPRPPRPPSGGGGRGGYSPPPRPTSTFGTNKFGVSRDAEFAFGQTLGFTLGNVITGAITQGFMIGVGLMTKPFEYFVGAFGERVKDELDDLKAAGGLYSISKRSENPFLKNIDEAIQYQQETNKTFAKMAASLPGVTNDYVQVGKRLSDTAARIVTTDFDKARTEANRIRSTEEGRKFYGGTITGKGAEQQRQTITTLLGELTKKTTIAGLGGRSGAGGVAGAYGLPGLTERMISQQQVSMGQFQRYAAVFSDPAIADALKRNLDKLNTTKADSMERFQAMQKLLDEIVTPDLIEKLRTSVDGVYQGLRSAIFDPDTGLFGLGRNFEKFGKRLNQYGQYVNDAGEVVTDLSKAADENLSIFEILRDIFSNAGQALSPIVEALPLIFDPLKKIGQGLMDARHYTAEFARTFNQYREGLKALSNTKGMDSIKDTLDIRASLSAISNLLLQFGVIGKGEFGQIAAKLTSKDLDIGAMLSGLLDKVFNSKIAYNVGEVVGNVVGTVLSETSKVVAFFAGLTDDSSKLAEGLKKGFYAAGGPEAFRSIIRNVFKALFKAAIEIFKTAPLEITALGSIALLLPATVAAFSIAFANKFEKVLGLARGRIDKQLAGLKTNLGNSARKGIMLGGLGAGIKANAKTTGISNAAFRPVGPRPPKGFEHIALPGKAPSMVGGVTSPGRAPAIGKPIAPLKRTPFGALSNIKAKGVSAIAASVIALSTQSPKLAKASTGIKEFGKGAVQVAKKIPGLSVAVGALDFGLRKASGQGTGQAAGGAIGAGLGAAGGAFLGSALGPGGTLAGGILGSFLGDWLGSNIGKALENLPQTLSGAWSGFVSWIQNLPVNVGYALGSAKANMESTIQKVLAWLGNLGKEFGNTMNRLGWQIRGMWEKFKKTLSEVVSGKFDWAALSNSLSQTIWNIIKGGIDGVSNFAGGIGNWFSGLGKGFEAGYRETKGGYTSTQTQQRQAGGTSVSPVFNWAKGGLGDAVASEMRMKPPGSNLVVANSSETIIPADHGFIPPRGMFSSSRSGMSSAPISVSAPITIYQQPGQSTDELASLVAIKIGEAVADARASSIFV